MYDLCEDQDIYLDAIVNTNFNTLEIVKRDPTKVKECGDLELDTLECMQAYGRRRGIKLCKNFLEDYRECVGSFMQIARAEHMTRERLKQVIRGERSVSNMYDSIKPPRDAYLSGPFFN